MHPYVDDRVYTPPDALLPDYLSMLATLGVERAVLVQPSIHGTDNSALLEALGRLPLSGRGIIALGEGVDDYKLRELDEAGIRGVRFNLVDVTRGRRALPMEHMRQVARRVRPLGWHVEVLLHVDEYPQLERLFRSFPGDLVFAHLGYPRSGGGVDDPGFRQLLGLLGRGNTWVKLTAPYRLSREALPYEDVMPLIHALADRAPDRLLWGSDWPHVRLDGAMPNDGDLCDLLLRWLPDPALREHVLVDNPDRLYRF